jgi:NAD(P)-dependent dehydrogenase (short-subunit alcohol dehydrogenase family)
LRPLDLRSGDENVLDEMWAVNVKAPYRLIRLALPYLEKSGNGRIINIASTDGKRYRDTVSVAYAMTKHAVLALTHAAKFAGWEKGVRVTALCPGAVDTDFVAGIPGVTPSANRISPATIGETISFLLRLPNTASVAELVMNTRLESWI